MPPISRCVRKALEGLSRRALTVNVHEIAEAGPIYRDANVTIRAIAVPHGSWPQAFGYAIDADGRTIVISGDTAPSEDIEKACHGCDVLVHEVYSADRFEMVFGRAAANITRLFIPRPKELAELASKRSQSAGAVPPALLRAAERSGPRERDPARLFRRGGQRPRSDGVLTTLLCTEPVI